MKISIVTPSYNQGQFIEQTIKSVLDQGGDFYIDYLIADGGSTDNSVEVIKKYDELLKKGLYPIKCRGIEFRWWSRKDKGQSDAINQGFRLAKGEILAWINSDDFYEPGAFEIVLRAFYNHPNISFINGDCYGIMFSEERKISKSSVQTFETALRKGNNILQPAVFFKRDAFEEVGGLDVNLHYSMDIDLWIRLLKRKESLYMPTILATYRLWEESKSVKSQDKFWGEKRKVYKRYGGRFFDPVLIYRIKRFIPYLDRLRKTKPEIYFGIKKMFYICYNALYYHHKK